MMHMCTPLHSNYTFTSITEYCSSLSFSIPASFIFSILPQPPLLFFSPLHCQANQVNKCLPLHTHSHYSVIQFRLWFSHQQMASIQNRIGTVELLSVTFAPLWMDMDTVYPFSNALLIPMTCDDICSYTILFCCGVQCDHARVWNMKLIYPINIPNEAIWIDIEFSAEFSFAPFCHTNNKTSSKRFNSIVSANSINRNHSAEMCSNH